MRSGSCGVVGDGYWFSEDVSGQASMNWRRNKLTIKKLIILIIKLLCNIIKIKEKLWLLMKSFGGLKPLSKMTLPIVAYDKHYNKMCPCT